MTAAKQIIDAALKLPEAERVRIVEELVGSLSPGTLDAVNEQAFAAELDRRLAEAKQDPEGGISWDELKTME